MCAYAYACVCVCIRLRKCVCASVTTYVYICARVRECACLCACVNRVHENARELQACLEQVFRWLPVISWPTTTVMATTTMSTTTLTINWSPHVNNGPLLFLSSVSYAGSASQQCIVERTNTLTARVGRRFGPNCCSAPGNYVVSDGWFNDRQ